MLVLTVNTTAVDSVMLQLNNKSISLYKLRLETLEQLQQHLVLLRQQEHPYKDLMTLYTQLWDIEELLEDREIDKNEFIEIFKEKYVGIETC